MVQKFKCACQFVQNEEIPPEDGADTEGPVTTQPTSQENRSYGSMGGMVPPPTAATSSSAETGYQAS